MMKASSSLFVLCSFALVACTGEVVSIGEQDQALSSPVEGVASGGALPACEAPSGPVHAYTSIADTDARIAGTWLLCAGGISSPADSAGIELGVGQARFLVKDGHALARKAEPAYERSVAILDTTSMNGPGAYQINLEDPAGGTNMYSSRASEDGRFLELNEGTSAKQARYVRVNAPPACGIAGAAHVYTSIADVSARVAGTWSVCSGGITSPAETTGLELEGSRAYFLVAASGALARGAGWDFERDVEILDTSVMNGPGSYQINLRAGAGTNMYHSRVSESGDVLELDEGTSGKKVVYRRAP